MSARRRIHRHRARQGEAPEAALRVLRALGYHVEETVSVSRPAN